MIVRIDFMHFVLIDLEWNNTYGRKTKRFINEIIEIGAIMLDGDLKEISRYSCFIKSQIGKKLRGSVKQMTHITKEDLDGGIPFTKALSELRRWIGGCENTVVTWGDGDIRVMIENYRYLNGLEVIPFLSNYANLQGYFQRVMKTSPARQVGLGAAAEMLGIDTGEYALHRAIDDCELTAECFRKIYDKDLFREHIIKCDSDFYGKLSFKPFIINNINSPLIDKSKLSHNCEICGAQAKMLSEWKYTNRYFRALFYCPNCDKTTVGVSFKKLYDGVETKKSSVAVAVVPEEDSAAKVM